MILGPCILELPDLLEVLEGHQLFFEVVAVEVLVVVKAKNLLVFELLL